MIDVMKMALEALEYHQEQTRPIHKTQETIITLRQAIEQAEKEAVLQEISDIGQWDTSDMAHRPNGLAIDDDDIQEYKRPWVGLTDDESSDIYNAHHNTYGECITSAYDLVLDVEAKLKEKNNG